VFLYLEFHHDVTFAYNSCYGIDAAALGTSSLVRNGIIEHMMCRTMSEFTARRNSALVVWDGGENVEKARSLPRHPEVARNLTLAADAPSTRFLGCRREYSKRV